MFKNDDMNISTRHSHGTKFHNTHQRTLYTALKTPKKSCIKPLKVFFSSLVNIHVYMTKKTAINLSPLINFLYLSKKCCSQTCLLNKAFHLRFKIILY